MGITDILMLLGGLGLFLYGMQLMGEGLERAAGSSLKALLSKLTQNRFFAMLLGLGITALIQSSSATTVMVVGFVNADLMTLAQSVGVIMGANIGTTVTGQIIALNTTILAYTFSIVGGIMVMFIRNKRWKNIGCIFMGLGILFFGMQTMSTAMKPLRDVEWFKNALTSFKNPFIGLLAGAVFTAIIQSSSAAVGILQAFAMQDLITLDASVYVLLGMNIGTCVTAMLSCIGTNRNAKRAATIHLLFNILGALLIIPIIRMTPIVEWMISVSPDNVVRQIANTHTLFKIIATAVLLPFGDLLVTLSRLIVKGEDPVHSEIELRLEFVDDRVLEAPTLAVSMIKLEIDRMCAVASKNLHSAFDAFLSGDISGASEFAQNERLMNFLNAELTRYLARISSMSLSHEDALSIAAYFHVISDAERIGDHAENIMEYAQIRVEHDVPFSDVALGEITDMRDRVTGILRDALALFDLGTHDAQLEAQVYIEEENVDEQTKILHSNHIRRLGQGICNPESGMMFADLLSDMERIGDHATNIAYALIKTE